MDKRQQLLKRLDKAWSTFNDSYAELSGDELLESGVTGAWSVKDIIAHVTAWEAEALKHLPIVLAGERPPRYSVTYGGIDAFNAQTTAHKRNLPLSEVLRERDKIHARLIEFIGAVPEDQLNGGTRFRHRLRVDTYGHYPKHTQAIAKWRTRRFTI